MGANPALTGTEMTRLAAKKHSSKFYLSYVPDTVAASATVAATPTTTPITQLTTTGESNWSSMVAGMTVRITSPGGVVRGYFLLTQTSSAGTLNIGEVDNADPGMIAQVARVTGIEAGDTIEILARFDFWSIKPYVTPDGTINQRFNLPVGTLNALPEPIVNVTINGEAGDYATIITTSTKSITAVATPVAWPTSSSDTYTYAWTYPAAMTGVSGATTNTLTGNLPPGSYWLYCLVTPSTAAPFTIARWVRIHNSADMPVAIIRESDVADRSGRRMTIRIPQSVMGNIPRGAYVLVWTVADWNGGDVPTARKKFGGWIVKRPFSHSLKYHESRADILGVMGVLEKLSSSGVNLNYTGATSTWEGLPASLQNIFFAMRWVLTYRVANVLKRFNLTLPDMTGDTKRRKNISVGSGTVAGQLKQLAEMVDANIGSRSDGEVLCAYHPSMLEDRSGVVKRGAVNNTHYAYIGVEWREQPECGLMRYVGVWALDLLSDLDIGSQWPDDKDSGQAGGSENRTNKVFENQTDADQRCGRAAAMANNPHPHVQTEFPSNWDVWECVDMQEVDQVVPAERSPTGAQITITTIPLNVTLQSVGGPIQKLQMIAEAETNGLPGHYINVQPAQTSLYGPKSNPLTSAVKTIPASWGKENSHVPVQAANSKGLLLATQEGFAAEGGWRNLSPTASQRAQIGTSIKLIADPRNYKRLILFGSQGALICDDKTAAVPVWRTVNLASSTGIERLFSTLTVPADGSTVSTPATTSGQAYRIDFSGTWVVGLDGATPLNGDACYRQGSAGSAYNLTDVQCYVNGAAPSPLPPVSATHMYSIAVTGNGSAIGLKCQDGNYTDNSGSISALIYQVGGTSNEIFIADICGSINREGYFCWLSKKTVGGTDYVYFSYSTNYFRSVQTKQVAKYDSSLIYSISLRSYNSINTGVIEITAGATSDNTAKVYKSADWGATWTATTQTITAKGGLINVPYAKSGGAANSANPPQYALVRGTASGNIQGVGLAGGSATIASGTADYPFGPYSLNSFTLDGAYLSLMMRSGSAYWSNDAGVSWAAGGSAMPGSTSFIGYGMTGSPTNKNFGLGFGYRALAFTTTRGTPTWTDLWANYRAFAGSAFGASAGEHVVSAFADLALLYGQAVSQ